MWLPHTDSNRGPTDCKAFILREGSSLAVAADITNLTSIPVFQEELRQLNPKRSSVILFIDAQVHLKTNAGYPRVGVGVRPIMM